MKRLRVIILGFLIFVTSTVSAVQSLNPPTNPASPESPTIVTVPGWTYRGCYTDRVDSRTLTAKIWTGKLTPGRCANLCNGWKYCALESGNQCYCGNSILSSSIPVPDNLCANVCSVDARAACGGKDVLSLYEADQSGSNVPLLVSPISTTNAPKPAPPKPRPSPGPPAVAKVRGWTYRGCWTDNPRDRTLITKAKRGNITPERCAEICRGFHFFGLEYSSECFCGNYLSHSAREALENACSLCCMGDFEAICGGRNMLSLYEADEPGITVS